MSYGIHQQSVAQFAGGAGELAQNQHTAFVPARRQKFLGDQVHAVVQRRDHAEICRAVVGCNLVVAMLPLQEHDGLPLV